MTLRTIPIRKSANRHNLFLEGDREMVMFTALLCAVLIFAAQSWYAFIFGCVAWGFSLFLLRLMAKSDPKMRQVYLRSRKYNKYYPARSTPFRKNTAAQGKSYD